MGANFVSFKVNGTQAQIRKAFESEQELDRYENGHSYSGGIGMASGLKFIDTNFTNEQEAEQWLAAHAQKWEEALAVKLSNTADQYVIGAWCSS